MQRCLQLAGYGAGAVAPNPMVGAVLVHNDRIIGEGYHMQYGGPHAEVNCINSVPDSQKHLIKESTLYVSLEPCNHFGKTPPCSDLIIRNEISRVVIACSDPFEKVNGTGIQKLKSAGIEVIQDVLKNKGEDINKRFFTFHKKQRPYIILKWAQSNNLKIAGENFRPVKISNDITDRLVHKWRSEEAAIMIGTRTALQDDPSLTTRLWPGNNPVRIVIDSNLKLPLSLKLFDESADTIILNRIKQEISEKNLFYKFAENKTMQQEIVNILRELNIISLLVEGGATLIQSFIDYGLWDEARVITNKELQIENGINSPQLKNAAPVNKQILFSAEITWYKNNGISSGFFI